MNVLNKLFGFLLLIFIGFLPTIYSVSFNTCGVQISEPWFVVKDNLSNDVVIVDNDGDLYFEGVDHQLNNVGSQSSFQIGYSFFNKITSKFDIVKEKVTSFTNPSQSFLIKNSSGTIVTKFFANGNISTKGSAVYNGSNANCPADGVSCSGNIATTIDNFCSITGSKTGVCSSRITSTSNCTSLEGNYCSSDNLSFYKTNYGCGSGSGCFQGTDTLVQNCAVSATQTGTWTCLNTSTRTQITTTFSPLCSGGGCLTNISNTNTQVINCGVGNYCSGGTCKAIKSNWVGGSWSSCNNPCGPETTSKTRICENSLGIKTPGLCSGSATISKDCGNPTCGKSYWRYSSNNKKISSTQLWRKQEVCWDSKNKPLPLTYCDGTFNTAQNTQECNGKWVKWWYLISGQCGGSKKLYCKVKPTTCG